MNHSDSEEMAGALVAAGCGEATSLEAADLVVINSCAIREAAEQKVIGRMGHLARMRAANPALRVVLTGCSVREDNAAILKRRYPQVDLFLRPDQEGELVARLGLAGSTSPGRLAGPLRRDSATSAWLPIIYGCDKTCTYCIVPFARGPERSRPFDELIDEARSLAAAGYREVTLLGQNVNSYGHDLAPDDRFADIHRSRELGRRIDLDGRPDIAALLRTLDDLRSEDGAPAIPRVRFVTSHPWDLSDRLIAAMAELESVCEHLHLPVQSGDDTVLRRMGRQYTIDAYLGLVEKLRAAIPGINLTTDVIVGFCGETEAQFENSLALLREVRFGTVFAAAFSPRPGTPAARLDDDVSRADKRRRLTRCSTCRKASVATSTPVGWDGRQRCSWISCGRPRRTTRAARRALPAATVRTSSSTSMERRISLDGWSRCALSTPGRTRWLARSSPEAPPLPLPPLIVIGGATATGKTGLSLELAKRIPGAEIISADSRQVYRGMDIGTAKVTLADRALVPHHGLDLVDPDQPFTAADYRRAALDALHAIAARSGIALLVGGSGLYLRAVARGLALDETGRDPVVRADLEQRLAGEGLHVLVAQLRSQAPRVAAGTDLANPRRVVRALERVAVQGDVPPPAPLGYPARSVWIGLNLEPSENDRRIAERARAQFAGGLLDEAAALRRRFNPQLSAFSAVGYREAFAHLDGTLTVEQALEETVARTRQLARRQRTWLRAEPDVMWLDPSAIDIVDRVIRVVRPI